MNNINELREKIKYAFFNGDETKGIEYAKEIVKNLDLDDDEHEEILLDIVKTIVFQNENIEFLDFLVENNIDCTQNWYKKGNFILQMFEGFAVSIPVFNKLVSMGVDSYSVDKNGRNIFHLLSVKEKPMFDSEKFYNTAIHIIEKCEVNSLMVCDNFGATPLHYMVLQNHIPMIEALLKKDIDINMKGNISSGNVGYTVDFNGITPLHLACNLGNVQIAQLLIEKGAKDDVKDNSGNSPASYIAQLPYKLFCKNFYSGSIPAREKIIENKVTVLNFLKNIDIPNDKGDTPLLALMKLDRFNYNPLTNIIPAFIERGVNIKIADNNGDTPLHLACECRMFDILKILVANGVEINVQNNFGNTPLHLAVKNAGSKEARYLIKKGADWKVPNNEGKTPFDIAVEKGEVDILELMI